MNLNTAGWASSSLRIVAKLFNGGVNNTVPVTAISETPSSVANADIALVPKGTGAILAQIPDGTVTGGNKRGDYATDLQRSRTGAGQVASGVGSVITGGIVNTSNGAYSVATGGYANISSSSYTFVGGGTANTSSNSYSAVCGGYSNTAGGVYSVVCGGISNTASGTSSFIGAGAYGSTRLISGYHVFPPGNAPIATTSGVSQAALLVMARATTDATATVLTSNSSAAATTNQITLPDNSAYSFSGEVIAGVTGAGDSARWTINGAIKRGTGVGTTVMIGTPTVTMTHFDAGASAWVVAVTANTTLGCISITVTGAAATTIRWVANINTTEMTY